MSAPDDLQTKILAALTRQPETSVLDISLAADAPMVYVQSALDSLVREGMVERHQNGRWMLTGLAVEGLAAALVASFAPTEDEEDQIVLSDLEADDPSPEQMAHELHAWASSQDDLTPHDEALVSAVLGTQWRTAPAIQSPTVYSEHMAPGTARHRNGVWLVGPRTARQKAMARHPSNSAGRRSP